MKLNVMASFPYSDGNRPAAPDVSWTSAPEPPLIDLCDDDDDHATAPGSLSWSALANSNAGDIGDPSMHLNKVQF